MAGLTRDEKLSSTTTTGDELYTMFNSIKKDVTKRAEIGKIFAHANCTALIANVAFMEKKYAFHQEAVKATNKDVVEVVRKETAIDNAVIFGHGSVEVLTACMSRFTMQDLSAFLSNPAGASLQNVVLAKVSELAGNDLCTLIQVLQAKAFVSAMKTPEQKLMLGLVLENATTLFQDLATEVSAQVETESAEQEASAS